MADTLVERAHRTGRRRRRPGRGRAGHDRGHPARRRRRAGPPHRHRPDPRTVGPRPGPRQPTPTCGCAGCSPAPTTARWSRWSPAGGCSPTGCAGSSCCATRPAAPPGAGHPSATPTTSPPRRAGGPTSAGNGQGLCEACNHTKQAPGWRARPGHRGAGTTVEVTTPTGHTYTSRPPPPPANGHVPQTSTGPHDQPRPPDVREPGSARSAAPPRRTGRSSCPAPSATPVARCG